MNLRHGRKGTVILGAKPLPHEDRAGAVSSSYSALCPMAGFRISDVEIECVLLKLLVTVMGGIVQSVPCTAAIF